VTHGVTGQIDLAITSGGLDAMLRGELTLEEALEDDTLELRGELDQLADFLEALNAWLHGALRSPGLARMHGAYLSKDDDEPAHEGMRRSEPS
jgi:hypothetical protein